MTVFIAGGVGDVDSVALELDATLNVKIAFSNKITSHPVEERSSISDHAFNENLKLDIEAVVSNTPVPSSVRQDKNLLTPSNSEFDSGRVQRAYDIIKKWYKDRTPITIVTDVEDFPNCVMSTLNVPRSVEWANAVKFEMSFEQIRVTNTRTALLLVTKPRRDESEEETKGQGQQKSFSLDPVTATALGTAITLATGSLSTVIGLSDDVEVN